MKYLVQWESRENADEGAQARSLQVFSKWTPSEGMTFHQFLGRVDARGGCAVVETDDVTLIARDMAIFAPFFNTTVCPVIDIQDSARITGDALEFRAAV